MPQLLSDGQSLMHCVFTRASSDTPWQVCEQCSGMFDFDREKAREQLLQNRATGKPSSGFRVCEITQKGNDTVVLPVDEEAFHRMFKTVKEAVDQVQATDGGAQGP